MNYPIDISKEDLPNAIDALIDLQPDFQVIKDFKGKIKTQTLQDFDKTYQKFNIRYNEIDKIYSGDENDFTTCLTTLIYRVILSEQVIQMVFKSNVTLLWDDIHKKFKFRDKDGYVADLS